MEPGVNGEVLNIKTLIPLSRRIYSLFNEETMELNVENQRLAPFCKQQDRYITRDRSLVAAKK
jgi:hypothetical protein